MVRQPASLLGAALTRALAPLYRGVRARGTHPWVIGGHRGRLYADNAAALHARAVAEGQSIVWIASRPLADELAARGLEVRVRDSLAARLAILRAPVALTSHGDDDLDTYALLFRRAVGLRVHLNHAMNHLKAGQWYRLGADRLRGLRRWVFARGVVYFDWLLASSRLEAEHFGLSFPDRRGRILPEGGGAHIDKFPPLRTAPTDRTVLWFPTFRENVEAERRVDAAIAEVIRHPDLLAWLAREDRTLVVCRHVNAARRPVGQAAGPPPERIRFADPAELGALLERASCLVSDYSSVAVDWLVTDRPAIFFPFDLDDYRGTRRFYIPYEDWHYGPLVTSAQALVDLLVGGTWTDTAAFEERRRRWLEAMFPHREPVYAARCLAAVRELARAPLDR